MGFRIVQVIPHADWGGMQQVAHDLNKSLPAHGIESSILDLRAWTSESVHADRGGVAGKQKLLAGRGWWMLARSWKTDRPDAVMAHTIFGAAYSLSAARVTGVSRRIVVVHGSRQLIGSTKTFLLAALSILGVATDVVFVGHSAAQSFGPVRRWLRDVVIQNGISLPISPSQSPDVDPDRAHLVCVSRLVEEKNCETAIRAVAQATAPIRLHVFGDGELRAELMSLAAELEAPATFHGHVDHADLLVWHAVSTAFLFPTLDEGLPLVLIEAAAGGAPVIASDRLFNREVMGEAAIYCDPLDDRMWAEAIDLVVHDEEMRERMRAAGLERTTEFTVDRMTEDYAALLLGEG